MRVTKRDGSIEDFRADKINDQAERACEGLDNVSASEVVLHAKLKLYDGVTTKEIDQALIESARSMIEIEPEYSLVASRLLGTTLYKEAWGEDPSIDDVGPQYRSFFVSNLEKMVELELLSPELLKFDMDKITSALNPEQDRYIQYLGMQTLYDRYLVHHKKRRLETPQAFLMRVAMGLSYNEKNKEETAISFYNKLSTFDVLSSTPTLFNAGTMKSQLSSCYLNTFDDSIDGIFDGLWQEARKSKHAGGLGFDMTPFRPRGDFIKGTNGETQGAVYFWKLYNDLLIAVNQGGKRKGAGCAYLETWHADLEDFLLLRKNTGDERARTHDMNTANWIPDLFMKQVMSDGPWYLFSSHEAPDLHETYGEEFEKKYWEYVEKGKKGELRVFEEKSAKELWKKMLRSLFETGHPWITFKDPSNIRYAQQHEGVVHSSNLCTEILEHTVASTYEEGVKTKIGETAVCNLASINLAHHVEDAEIQWDRLADTVKTTIRMLDNVIDLNYYPTQEARNSNMKHRFIGMGSMGWQDMYYMLGVNYESEEAVKLADKVYEFISYHAIQASSDLAAEKGTYPTYEGSLWSQGIFPIDTYRHLMEVRGEHAIMVGEAKETLDWSSVRESVAKNGMRNALTMAIAPTATISYIAGCSQSTEPDFSVLFVYSTLSGEFTVVNRHFVADMKRMGLWDDDMAQLVKHVDGDLALLDDSIIPPSIKQKYKPAFRLDQSYLLKCAAARQKWIDQGMSLNLYNNATSLKNLNDIYTTGWQMGLKTTYYLRNEAASRVEKSTIDKGSIERILEEKMNGGGTPVMGKSDETAPVKQEAQANQDARNVSNKVDMVNPIECVGCQ